MDLERAYQARGLPYERPYCGSEFWSDDEEQDLASPALSLEGAQEDLEEEDLERLRREKEQKYKNRKYVNKLAELNAKRTGSPPGKVNELKFVSPPLLLPCSEDKVETSVSLPYVPRHVTKTLGMRVTTIIWDEFLSHGASATGCTARKHLSSIARETVVRLGRELPFSKLNLTAEAEDYVPFIDVVEQLALFMNAPSDDYIEKNPPARLPSCCAFRACRKHRVLMPGEEPEEPDEDLIAPFFLETVYGRWKLNRHGNLRRKDVPGIMAEAGIPFDRSRLPSTYWKLYGDFLIEDSVDMMEVVEAIRIDMDKVRENKLDPFKLPRWLKNEFSVSEIKLFIHHFKSIDIDGGGSIDAEELQKLTESLGSKISVEEAQELIDENDEDGSGTIDFEEFMTLMFRIQHGTIDLENNRLGRAIMESKTQLTILQEIDEIHRNPPFPEATVGKYGGCPVVCEYWIEGPADTPYEGGSFKLVVRYNPGYPYTCPSVTVGTRIYCINVMPKINGDGVLDHLPTTWDCNWNSKKLLLHFFGLMKEQDYSLIPVNLYNVAFSYFEQPEFKEDNSLSSSLADSKVDALKFPDLFDQLARIEQVQVNNIILYMGDRSQYDEIARQFTRQFASKKSTKINLDDDWEEEEKKNK